MQSPVQPRGHPPRLATQPTTHSLQVPVSHRGLQLEYSGNTAGAAPGNPPGVSITAGSFTDVGAPEADAVDMQDFYELEVRRGMPMTRTFGSRNRPCDGSVPVRYRGILQQFSGSSTETIPAHPVLPRVSDPTSLDMPLSSPSMSWMEEQGGFGGGSPGGFGWYYPCPQRTLPDVAGLPTSLRRAAHTLGQLPGCRCCEHACWDCLGTSLAMGLLPSDTTRSNVAEWMQVVMNREDAWVLPALEEVDDGLPTLSTTTTLYGSLPGDGAHPVPPSLPAAAFSSSSTSTSAVGGSRGDGALTVPPSSMAPPSKASSASEGSEEVVMPMHDADME